MGSKTRQIVVGTKFDENNANLLTSSKIKTRLARPIRVEFDNAAQMYDRPVSVWNCLWGHALKRSAGINRKSRALYSSSGFISNVA